MKEDPFEAIANEAIKQAEAVEASLSDFAEGLRTIRDFINLRIEAVESELGEG